MKKLMTSRSLHVVIALAIISGIIFMVVSVFDLFKIGIGLLSFYIVGLMKVDYDDDDEC